MRPGEGVPAVLCILVGMMMLGFFIYAFATGTLTWLGIILAIFIGSIAVLILTFIINGMR